MRITGIGAGRRVPALIHQDSRALGACLARRVLAGIELARRVGRPFLLGCPGGRSPVTTYEALGELSGARDADLSDVTIVMMDEYVLEADDGYEYCPAGAHYSCRRFASENIVAVLNRGLPDSKRIRAGNVWFPDPRDPAGYDGRIRCAGGIDIFIVASGASDGHVAFNPPQSTLDCVSRVVPLAETTRRDNLGTFPDFASIDEVPGHGVSVGLATIRNLSREVALVVTGEHKRGAVDRLNACADFDATWPASLVYECDASTAHLDETAAAGLGGGS